MTKKHSVCIDKNRYYRKLNSLDNLDKLTKTFSSLTSVELIDLEQPETVSKSNSIDRLCSSAHLPVGEKAKEGSFRLYSLCFDSSSDTELATSNSEKKLDSKITLLPQVTPIMTLQTTNDLFLPKSLQKNMEEYKNVLFSCVMHSACLDTKFLCVMMCKEQKYSRAIQEDISSGLWSENEFIYFFNLVFDSIVEISNNIFGNYIIQVLLDKIDCDKLLMVDVQLSGNIYHLSTNMYGCRVVQAFLARLDKMPLYEKNNFSIYKNLCENIQFLINDLAGHHVVQFLLNIMQCRPFIFNYVRENCVDLARMKYGCKIVQCLIRFPNLDVESSTVKNFISSILLDNIHLLIRESYGNYLVQELLVDSDSINKIFYYILPNFVELCKDKYSSNVIEKIIAQSDSQMITQYCDACFRLDDNTDTPHIISMIDDRFANYVVQDIYFTGNEKTQKKISAAIFKYQHLLKESKYAKHLIWKIRNK